MWNAMQMKFSSMKEFRSEVDTVIYHHWVQSRRSRDALGEQDGNAAHKWGGLGEVLGGNKLIDSQIKIKFGKNVDRTIIFDVQLDACKVKQFKDVIENSYWIEFFMACSVSLFM
ncbi:hypothetical protein Nepgr_033179 [Nepenthes gracilis]|uniref:Transmembrane 9 superfamily member n=1 Tax=Nepenthes gracilis TaxID=150966 RepID=A0AAD3Y8U5_NEPGR|nr:hypothetical protein Nepgr_033179 [Nepenthes gracilis]